MGEQRAGYETSEDYGEPGAGRPVPRRKILRRTGRARPRRFAEDNPIGRVLNRMSSAPDRPGCQWRPSPD